MRPQEFNDQAREEIAQTAEANARNIMGSEWTKNAWRDIAETVRDQNKSLFGITMHFGDACIAAKKTVYTLSKQRAPFYTISEWTQIAAIYDAHIAFLARYQGHDPVDHDDQ